MEWDITHEQALLMAANNTFFFDPRLSYETTKYRPLTIDKGLDFDPAFFMEEGAKQRELGRYSGHKLGSKTHRDYWFEQHDRCLKGYEFNGYRVTGDNYFFLNFYTMNIYNEVGSIRDHPAFWEIHYRLFHYIELCQILMKFDAGCIKSRGVGLSEIAGSLGANLYINKRGSRTMYLAYAEKFVKDILDNKVWPALDWCDSSTEDAFVHAMIENNDWCRHSGLLDKKRLIMPSSFDSKVNGITADKPDKVRGDRCNFVMFEESGSNAQLLKSWSVAKALVMINGVRHGIRLMWGTGGSEGKDIEGLKEMTENPRKYSILPYRHNCTESGEYANTVFFVPSWSTVMHAMDHRGVIVDEEKARQFYLDEQALLTGVALRKIKAEYCFTIEDALSLEGDNQFDKELLAEQYDRVVLRSEEVKFKPKIGRLELNATKQTIDGEEVTREFVTFVEDARNGKVLILEEPIKVGGAIPANLYVAGVDSIDQAENDSITDEGSKLCALVKKRDYGSGGNMYVAMYLERPKDIRTGYENTRKLLMYYGCKANVEYSKIGIVKHFKQKKCGHLWVDRPKEAAEVSTKSVRRKRNRLIGTQPSERLIRYGLELITDYIQDYYDRIYFPIMIEQLLKYSYQGKTKFDVVAAMQMAEIADEDMHNKKIEERMVEIEHSKPVILGYYIDSYGRQRYGDLNSKE